MDTKNLNTAAAMQNIANHFTGNGSLSKDEYLILINREVTK